MIDIIIGDEHCRGKFKNIYDMVQERTDIRYIICLGDYFDPYQEYTIEDKIANFMHIIKIARQDNRVKLLFGNHDMHYLINTNERSRKDIFNSQIISKVFFETFDLFSLAIDLGNSTVVSHAGISPKWTACHGYSSIDSINKALKACVNSETDEENLDFFNSVEAKKMRSSLKYDEYHDFSGCGDCKFQPPTWIRPGSLIEQEKDWAWDIQIVGHTRTDIPETKKYFLNPLSVENFNELKFDGDIETIKIRNSNKQLIMVDTGESLNYLEREV